MKIIGYVSLTVITLWAACNPSSTEFDQNFMNKTLRIDYLHTGNAEEEAIAMKSLMAYNGWAGSQSQLIDTLPYGKYQYQIYDSNSGRLLYTKGFDSYFKEYQVSTPAIEGTSKSFEETALIPYPRNPVEFALAKRDNYGTLHEIFRSPLDPSQAIEGPIDPTVQVFEAAIHGNPSDKADIAIIGDGYTAEEEDKFRKDLMRFTETLFRPEPLLSARESFNVRGILKPSEDSGIDEPRAGIDKNTAVSATFNSMGSERYVLTEDHHRLRDLAGHAPYDAIVIMVNHERYGGGGIYNFFCVFTTDNVFSDYLFVHEFGHSFFGLADEYYTSSTAYNDFYPPGYEPAEANVTALTDPDNVKWKHLVTEDIEMPTPWKKAYYDSLSYAWQQRRAMMNDRIARLKRDGATPSAVLQAEKEYEEKSLERETEVQAFFTDSPFAGTVGAFEGAGYASEGLYRPAINCMMFTRCDFFCPVCQEAMRGIISLYAPVPGGDGL